MGYSAFQSNAFQRNAYQIQGKLAPVAPAVSGFGYNGPTPYDKYKENEYQREKLSRHKAELARVERELADAEHRRLEAIAKRDEERLAKKAAKELAALEDFLQAEINRLRKERAWLMRWIDDEEAILVLLLSLPFH